MIGSVLRCTCALTLVALVAGGCDEKKTASPTAVDATVVVLSGADLKPDGSIAEAGLAKIRQKASVQNLNVSFVRAPLSDQGLAQLTKFPTLRRVEAIGSRITPKGMETLKAAIPEVEVVH